MRMPLAGAAPPRAGIPRPGPTAFARSSPSLASASCRRNARGVRPAWLLRSGHRRTGLGHANHAVTRDELSKFFLTQVFSACRTLWDDQVAHVGRAVIDPAPRHQEAVQCQTLAA